MSICVAEQWCPSCVDFKQAFLQSDDIERDVYVQPPKEWKGSSQQVWKLKKPLYGLKDAPRLWHKTLAKHLKELEFQRFGGDSCIWYHPTGGIFMVHVDDAVMAGTKAFKEAVVPEVLTRFEGGSK